MNEILRQNWKKLMESWELLPSQGEVCLQDLQKRYSEKHRAYHTLQHIAELLELWERDKGILEMPHWIGMAIWFHDAIYDPASKKNELHSADLFRDHASKWKLPHPIIQSIHTYILDTQKHRSSLEHNDLHWFLDADLSILGADAERYRAYAEQVRFEYKKYPKPLYRMGRKKVLRYFLEKERLYLTEAFERARGEKARENLKWELEWL